MTKIPRFSSIIKSDAPAIESPLSHENSDALPTVEQKQFHPRVAIYTALFVGALIGGVLIGARSKDMIDNQEVNPPPFSLFSVC